MSYANRSMLACLVLILSATRSSAILADDSESLEALRAARVESAQEWWKAITQTLHAPNDYLEYFRASRALLDAELGAAKSKTERIHALEAYRDRGAGLYKEINALYQVNARGGDAERRAEARFHELEAKIWLKEEQAKP